MTQSSCFTKTAPWFPFADLCIPAGQCLSIHYSQTRGEGRRETTTDVWKIQSMRQCSFQKGTKPMKQLNPNAKASKMSGFRSRLRQLRKSPFKVHSSDTTRKKVAMLVNFTRSLPSPRKNVLLRKENLLKNQVALPQNCVQKSLLRTKPWKQSGAESRGSPNREVAFGPSSSFD